MIDVTIQKIAFTVSSDCSASHLPFPGGNIEVFDRVQDALYRIHHRPSANESLYLGARVYLDNGWYQDVEIEHIWDKWGEYKPEN